MTEKVLKKIIKQDGGCDGISCSDCPLSSWNNNGVGKCADKNIDTLNIAKQKLSEEYIPQVGDEVKVEYEGYIDETEIVEGVNIHSIVDTEGRSTECRGCHLTLISRPKSEVEKAEELHGIYVSTTFTEHGKDKLIKQMHKAIQELKDKL